MKTKELTCVVCPNGCLLEAWIDEGQEVQVKDIDGILCDKGLEWAKQEMVNPMRTIASSILVEGGDVPLVSVRTDSAIPLRSIFNIMKEVKAARAKAPVRIGDPLLVKPAGTDCTIIATRHVPVSS